MRNPVQGPLWRDRIHRPMIPAMVERRIQIVPVPSGDEVPGPDYAHWGRHSTPVGIATVAWSSLGIHFLTCGRLTLADAARWCVFPADHRGARDLLERIFAADDGGPFRVCLAGTAFQLAVWRALCAIPVGQPVSYGAVAAMIGRPRAFRAVGAACGANPVAVLIPCHRVIAGDGGLGGYSGGLAVKRRLLAREGWTPG